LSAGTLAHEDRVTERGQQDAQLQHEQQQRRHLLRVAELQDQQRRDDRDHTKIISNASSAHACRRPRSRIGAVGA
jgi:hypothetical protein